MQHLQHEDVTPQHARREDPHVELSVVIPCLNEADTLATCIAKAQRALEAYNIAGEILVADNGSTDGSQTIAKRMGVRVVSVHARGYGNALMGGIAAARGKYIIMGDADDSYDFLEIPKLLIKLREGYDLVQGCRLPAGGGTIMDGAMPFLHRRVAHPPLSRIVRWWFKAPIHDVYCGLRGFTRALYARLHQRCTGMEFATEMIIKAAMYGENMTAVPITLHPDGRKSHPPHLHTFRDGWRTLRFFLMYSPRWLFLMPGALLVLLGAIGYTIALPGATWRGVSFDAHTLLFASLSVLLGWQSMLFALFTKVFATAEGLLPADEQLERFFAVITLERGLIMAMVAVVIGVALLLAAVDQWRLVHFGHLDYAKTMRLVIPGVTLTALGFQTILASFFISILGMRRRYMDAG